MRDARWLLFCIGRQHSPAVRACSAVSCNIIDIQSICFSSSLPVPVSFLAFRPQPSLFFRGHGTVPPVFLCDYFCALQEAERAMSGGENGSARGERSDGLLLLCMQPLCCNDGVPSYCGLGFRDEERKSCFCVLTEIG